MKGLTLRTKEQNRLKILNGVLERHWPMREADPLLGVSERQRWRLLAAYRKEGARGVVHKNRGPGRTGSHPNIGPQSLGAITSRTGFFLSSFRKWREEVLLKEARLVTLADLGQGVMDNAMVEAAAYALERV